MESMEGHRLSGERDGQVRREKDPDDFAIPLCPQKGWIWVKPEKKSVKLGNNVRANPGLTDL